MDSLIDAESTVHEISPLRVPGSGRVSALAYADRPEPGYITGFTYGLSLASHPDWTLGGRELSITVRSDEIEWARVPARSVAALRGMCAFNRGQAIGHIKRYVDNSPMSSILLADPAFPWGSGVINLSPGECDSKQEGDLVEIVGVYPLHASERDFVYANGFDAFWSLEWDRFDPLRSSVV
ncbi:suppressor of fused domain protein [Streptomyces sp. TRM68367]|nr:suppressor of fused domain protein [Streptomyces sp. TRM68367]